MPTVGLLFETRSSDSSWIESVWTCRSGEDAWMTSVATQTWGLVFWNEGGAAHAAVTGPESRTDTATVPENATFLGIQFAVGTSLRMARTATLLDSGIVLPDVGHRRFRLDGGWWEVPSSDDAELLVHHLVRDGAVVRDPLVTAVARGRVERPPVTDRTLERRFRAATGLSRGGVRQIERVREAAELLTRGEAVSDVVDKLGYYDEPHLARALRRYVGRTAKQLHEGRGGAIALDPVQRTTS